MSHIYKLLAFYCCADVGINIVNICCTLITVLYFFLYCLCFIRFYYDCLFALCCRKCLLEQLWGIITLSYTRFSSYRAVNTLRHHHKNRSVNYGKIIAVCSQIHTQHMNTLCGQNIEFVDVKPGGT